MSSSSSSTGPRFWRSPVVRYAYPPVLLLQAAVHGSTLAPGISRGDAGDIATAAAELGVMHPTGYPIFTMLAHLFTRLPLDAEPVVAIELMNVLFMVGTTLFLGATVHTLAQRFEDARVQGEARARRWIADTSGLLAGILLAFAPSVWAQVKIPEVYPMHLMLVSWVCYLWSRFDLTGEERYVSLAALPLGIGLAHHLTIVYLFAATGLYLTIVRFRTVSSWVPHLLLWPVLWPLVRLGRRRRRDALQVPRWARCAPPRWWVPLGVVAIGALPLLSYAYLWWAATHTPALPWGGTDDWSALWRHATGRQYHGYLQGLGYEQLPDRVLGLPDRFDNQFLIGSAIPAFVGVVALGRRSPALVSSLLIYAGLNLQHGVRYSVSDYHVYFLPAFSVYTMFFGVGLARVCGGLGRAGRRVDVRYFGFVLALVLAIVAGSIAYYQLHRPTRLPDWALLSTQGPALLRGVVLTALALALVPHALVWIHRPRCLGGLAWASWAIVGATYVLPVVERTRELAKPDEAALYARSIVHDVPPGALFLTGGDSYAFPLWYQQHVLGEGRGFAVVNLHMYRYQWYREAYLLPRHPRTCDPRRHDPPPECDDYAARLAMGDEPWLEFDMRRSRGPISRAARPPSAPIIHGGERCEDVDARRQPRSRCGCHGIDVAPRRWDEVCVETAEDGGIVELTDREVKAHRLIQDHIDDRPVFERNVFTRWSKPHKNARDWNGPAYRRPSGDYALLNRGAANQIVHAADIDEHEACAPTLVPVSLRPLGEPDARPPRVAARPPYRPNPYPTLLSHASMAVTRDDLPRADRRFAVGEDIVLSLHWFEQFEYVRGRADRRGKPIRHGVRVCVYDPDGNRVWSSATTTMGVRDTFEVVREDDARRGTYTVQACSVGDLRGDRRSGRAFTRVPPARGCERTIAEFEFAVE